MKKRIFSIIFCVMTVLMMQSVLCCAETAENAQAFICDLNKNAGGEEQVIFSGTIYDVFEYISNDAAGDCIVLCESIVLEKSLVLEPVNERSISVVIKGNAEIDLNGNFITQCSGIGENDNPLFVVPRGSSLVIKDSSVNKNGKINGVLCAIGVEGGSVTVEGGVIAAQSGASEYDGYELPVKVTGEGAFVMTGGTIEYNGELLDGRTYSETSGAVFLESGAAADIRGGRILGRVIAETVTDIKITGGVFLGDVEAYLGAEYMCVPEGKLFSVKRRVPKVSGIYEGQPFAVKLGAVYSENRETIKKYVVMAQSETAFRKSTSVDVSQLFYLIKELDEAQIPQVEIRTDSVTVFLDRHSVKRFAEGCDEKGIYFVSELTDNIEPENKNILKNAKKQISYGFFDADNNEIKTGGQFNVSFRYVAENFGDTINLYDTDGTKLIKKKYNYKNGVVDYTSDKAEMLLISEGYGLKILGRALDLQGTISMVYYAMPENLDIKKVKMLFWTSPQTEYTEKTAERIVENNGRALLGYKFEFDNISSKDMNMDIYARLMAVTDKGEVIYSPVPSEGYSIRKYAQNMMKDDKLKQLLVKMLNYGTAAQEYFGTDYAPVNSVLSVGERATDFTRIYKSESQTIEENGAYEKASARIEGKTLLLDGDISIKYYTTWQAESGYDEAGILFWTENEFKTKQQHIAGTESYKTGYFEYNGDYRVFTYPNIVSSAMNEQVYARLYVRYGNEYRYSDIDSYSVRDYAANQLSKNSDEKLVKLLRTLMLYGEEAEKYFKRGIEQ